MANSAPNQSKPAAIITGASAGIGAALAKLLASKFPRIRLVLSARQQDKLEQVAASCRQSGAEVLVVPADLAQVEAAKAIAKAALDQFGRVDILVNNAGYGQMGPLELVPSAAVQRQFQVNVLAPIDLIQAVIPAMRDQGGGRIINISSIGGKMAFPLGSLYSSSKFALEGLSDALRMELEPFNIKVIVVEPGPVETNFFTAAKQIAEQDIANPKDTPYRAALEQMEDLEGMTQKQMWTSERVAEVICQAIAAPHPQPRYIAASNGDFLIFAMTKLLPTWAVDKFWQQFYGINLIARDWQNRSESKG